METIFFDFDLSPSFLENKENQINKLLTDGYFIKKDSLEMDLESYDYDEDEDYDRPSQGDTSFKLELVKKPDTIVLKEKIQSDLNEKVKKLENTGWNKLSNHYNDNSKMYESEMCFGTLAFYDHKKIKLVLRKQTENNEYFSGIYYDYKSELLNHIGYKKIQNFTLNGKAIKIDQLDKKTKVYWQFSVYYWDFEDEEFLNKKIKKIENYEDGSPRNISNYMNGEKHGEFLEYSGDNLSKRGFHNFGKKTGLHERWYKGKLIESENFKDGLLHGDYYFDNRNIPYEGSGEKQIGQYNEGKEIGQWEIKNWRNFTTKGKYIDGKKDGEWITYYPSGEKRWSTHYEGGIKIDKNEY